MSSGLKLPVTAGSIVDISVLQAGHLAVPTEYIVQKQMPGHDLIRIPCYSFLIENKKLGKKVLYDLGLMKAWKLKQPPAILDQFEFTQTEVKIEKDVADQLTEADIPLESIDAIIWSHHHVDHTGDPSLFPKSTALVVGPNFKSNKATFPGYPNNPAAIVAEDAFEGRELVELDFSDGENIGGFPAIDYFGDRSFYILQAEGHTHDHICALARTAADKFVFLGGDAAHHPGEYRPSALTPLPVEIKPSPFEAPRSLSACAGALFENIHPAKEAGGECKTKPFYALNPLMNVSMPDAEMTLNKMQLFDGSPDVFVIIAHDNSLLDVLPFFPQSLAAWNTSGDKTVGTWRFLRDFGKAVELAKTESSQRC